MKIHATLLLVAATVFGLQSAGATTVGLSLSLNALDSTVCTGASPDCTETLADIAPITTSYTRDFKSSFDGSYNNDFDLGNGRTLHSSHSEQGSNPALTGLDPDPVFAFLPPVNVTAEQLATGTNTSVLEAFVLDAGKSIVTKDGDIVHSRVSGDLFETQQWATIPPGGAWLSSSYSVDFSLFDTRVPMTLADLATPMSYGEFDARLKEQFLSGGDIFVSVTYILDDQANAFEQIDTYSGVAHLTSLDGLAPVPEAPVPLMMLTGLLMVGLQRLRRSAQRARARHSA
jgi:hypothetical protein